MPKRLASAGGDRVVGATTGNGSPCASTKLNAAAMREPLQSSLGHLSVDATLLLSEVISASADASVGVSKEKVRIQHSKWRQGGREGREPDDSGGQPKHSKWRVPHGVNAIDVDADLDLDLDLDPSVVAAAASAASSAEAAAARASAVAAAAAAIAAQSSKATGAGSPSTRGFEGFQAVTAFDFGISRLGIPEVSGLLQARLDLPPRPVRTTTSMDDCDTSELPPQHCGVQDSVRYLHIPRKSLKDFRDFAKDVAAQACRELAHVNPYVEALNRHRADLETPLVPLDWGDSPGAENHLTLEQRLSTKREALSTLSAVQQPPSGGLAGLSCGPDEAGRPRPCGIFGIQCCADNGEFGEMSVGDLPDLGVRPIPVLSDVGGFSPVSGQSVRSERSALSTSCSRQSRPGSSPAKGEDPQLESNHTSSGAAPYSEHTRGMHLVVI